ncbi:MAG: class I SAM-dependent methyltransferase, partial [Rhodothermaceae bacterium]|nr:class I SAM-dependent methyltransferase [Rhodothermaceae bacterium]
HEADDEPELWQERFEEEFLAHNVALIDALEEHLYHEHYDRLYEIGCGHGQVVEYLAERMKTISEFIGMDISEVQIEKNRHYYNHPKISFQAGDAVSWVQEEAKPRSIFLTNGGVFEYFLQEELELMFSHIASKLAPAIVGIIETIGSDHDLAKEHDSLVYGRELAFSHNYPYLMEKAGLSVVYHSERVGTIEHGGGRWIRVLGIKE